MSDVPAEWEYSGWIKQVAARLPADAEIVIKRPTDGGLGYLAKWQHDGDAWELEIPMLCLWTEIRGPRSFRWTLRERPSVAMYRAVKILDAHGAIAPTETPNDGPEAVAAAPTGGDWEAAIREGNADLQRAARLAGFAPHVERGGHSGLIAAVPTPGDRTVGDVAADLRAMREQLLADDWSNDPITFRSVVSRLKELLTERDEANRALGVRSAELSLALDTAQARAAELEGWLNLRDERIAERAAETVELRAQLAAAKALDLAEYIAANQELAKRVEGLEGQRDAVLELCDYAQTITDDNSGCVTWTLDKDDVREALGAGGAE